MNEQPVAIVTGSRTWDRRRLRSVAGTGRVQAGADVADIAALVEGTLTTYRRIDAVLTKMGQVGGSPPDRIASTGLDRDGSAGVFDVPDRMWHDGLDMYVLSVVRMARTVTPVMTQQGGGSFVNISSMNALEPRPGYSMMSVLRAALHGFAKLFADQHGHLGIRMNNLLPGFCENVNLTESALRKIPMNRPARFDEIGGAAVFLASSESSYITGQNILVDGGLGRAVR